MAQPTSSNPAVASMLVARRRAEDTARTIERIAAQTLPVSYLLVVNVEADAETEDVVRAWNDDRLEVAYLPVVENVGPAGGVALGVRTLLQRCPTADFVALFEEDDPPPSDASLARLVAHLQQRTASERSGGVGFHGAVLNRRSARLQRPDLGGDGSVDVDYIAGGSCPVFRRELLEEIGAYDPTLFFGFEELEFGLRARAAGWRLEIISDGTGRARRPATAGQTRQLGEWSWRRYYSLRNLMVILRRQGQTTLALRVGLVRGVAKPLVWLPLHPRLAARHLRFNVRAIRDAMAGRLGMTVLPEPSGHGPHHG